MARFVTSERPGTGSAVTRATSSSRRGSGVGRAAADTGGAAGRLCYDTTPFVPDLLRRVPETLPIRGTT